LAELNFEALPGIPQSWIDFLRSRLSLPPASRAPDALYARIEHLKNLAMPRDRVCRLLAEAKDLCPGRIAESIQRLRQPGVVAITASFAPSLFGGPAFQISKCLTAIKICEQLARNNLYAVPVCWLQESAPSDFSEFSIQLLDSEAAIRRLQLPQADKALLGPGDPLPWNPVMALLSQVEELGKGTHDPEMIEILRAIFSRETTLAQASARLVAALVEEWGMIVVNPYAPDFQSYLEDAFAAYRAQAETVGSLLHEPRSEQGASGKLSGYLVQSAVLPVAASVIDPYEVDSYVHVQPAFEVLKRMPPMAWPQASATVMDGRSRRIFERYGLDLPQLYSGASTIVKRFIDAIPDEASERLRLLKQETEDRVARLGDQHAGGKGFRKTAGSARERISYQLDRLREKLDAARQRKQETLERQIGRACNLLAPNGRIQERELAGIQLPLRYSRAVLRSLYEKMNILNMEHQLISME
jgi:uncharacterized protein YllA (UPF0747 family)